MPSPSKKVFFAGYVFHVYESVYDPAEDSFLFAENLAVNKGEVVLDMGTGCGLYAIFAAHQGAYSDAVDVEEKAIQCAQANVEMHAVGDRVKIIRSDIFRNIKSKQYNLIVTNPPIVDLRYHKEDSEELDSIERALLDDGSFFVHFLRDAKDYLKPEGRILMTYANTGFIEEFKIKNESI